MNKQLIAGWVALETLSMAPTAAYAEPSINPPSGPAVSYTDFLTAIKEHLIERVRLNADGSKAEFINIDGGRGVVNLFKDSNLISLLRENKVDFAVIPAADGPNPIF